MNWKELKVYNEYGDILGTLGELVADQYEQLPDIALDAHGAIDQWQQHAVAKPYETPGWEVPTGVDWTGLHAALLAQSATHGIDSTGQPFAYDTKPLPLLNPEVVA